MQQSVDHTPGSAQRRSNQLKLLILWLVPVGLMAIAGLCYYLVQTGQLSIGSKNHGVLIQPPLQLQELLQDLRPQEQAAMTAAGDAPWLGKWSLVVRGSAQCEQACRENLYLTRQLHIRLDKNANRVQRIYLSDSSVVSQEFKQFLADEHRLLKRYVADQTALAELDAALLAEQGERARFFIVDPAGWAMMYYLQEHNGNAMLQDLKHLLKYSRER